MNTPTYIGGIHLIFFLCSMKKLSFCLFLVLCVLYFSAYQSSLSHILFYHEQHHLFLYTKAYYHHIVSSEGILRYLTNFLIQFFYYPALGSILLALLTASYYLLTQYLLKKLTGLYDVLQLSIIPSLWAFLYTKEAGKDLTLIVGIFLFLCIASLILTPLKKAILPIKGKNITTKWKLTFSLSMATIFATGGYFFFLRHYNFSERTMLQTTEAVQSKDWDKVLYYTTRYQDAGRNNQLINYFHLLALYHKGELIHHLLDYPQVLGVRGLYLPWTSNSRECEFGHYVYEFIGHINEAHRWAFESMVVWGETAPVLKNLARYNILLQRPKVAQRFVNTLKQSLFYKKEAVEIEQQIKTGEVSGLHYALKNAPIQPARFSNILNIGPELQQILTYDPTNRMALEYLLCHLLLSNHIEKFVSFLPLIKDHYDRLPRIFEEALHIYALQAGKEKVASLGFSISPETEERFAQYYTLWKTQDLEALERSFRSTYWYYLHYISPYGSKVLQE